MVQDSYNSGPSMSSSSGGHLHQSCHVTKACLSLNWHQPTNLLSSSSKRLKECVLPPAMCRRMFAMMHLRNFCQVSIEKVRQVMTRSAVKVPLSTETVNGVVFKIGYIGVTHLLWKISGYATAALTYHFFGRSDVCSSLLSAIFICRVCLQPTHTLPKQWNYYLHQRLEINGSDCVAMFHVFIVHNLLCTVGYVFNVFFIDGSS